MAAAAGAGFAAQADLAALFVERAVQLTRRGGVVGMVLPAKLWIALAGGGVRALLAREAPVVRLDDGDFVEQPVGAAGFSDVPRALGVNDVAVDRVPVEMLGAGEVVEIGWLQGLGRHDGLSFKVTPGAGDPRVFEVHDVERNRVFRVMLPSRVGTPSDAQLHAAIGLAVERALLTPPEKVAGTLYDVEVTSADLKDAR